jgi:hypothetical protein
MGILRQVQGGDEEFRAETAAHVVKDMFKKGFGSPASFKIHGRQQPSPN